MRAVIFIFIAVMIATVNVANAHGTPPNPDVVEGWLPVPPLKDQSVFGNYCINRNLLYSIGDILCVGGEGLVCAQPPCAATGGRAYWSSVPVSRGDINWSPPAHCGK